MSKIFFSLSFFMISCNVTGQKQNPCNRAVDTKSYEKDLIKEVCIPKNHIITLLYTDLRDIDIDGDSLGDFIFNHRKPKLQELDTTYLTVYKKINDSTHVFLKTFKNLFPVYLASYDYPSKDARAKKVFACYNDGYPLKRLEMEKGVIRLVLRIDPASGYLLEYTYKPERKNWYLTTYQEWIDFQDGTRESQDRAIPEEGESIDEFSYQKYLCSELFPEKK
jgi:hypothetical protein